MGMHPVRFRHSSYARADAGRGRAAGCGSNHNPDAHRAGYLAGHHPGEPIGHRGWVHADRQWSFWP